METFRTRSFAITLCLLIVASATHAQEQKPTPCPCPSPSPSPTPLASPTPTTPPPIIYTGKLIGYFRSPSLQPSGLRGCPSLPKAKAPTTKDETPSNAAAVVLGTTLPAGAILLGTGDNFSPQFEARTFSPEPLQKT